MATTKSKFNGSKSLKHVKAYPLVASLVQFLHGFALYNYFAARASTVSDYAWGYASKMPLLASSIVRIDETTDSVVLNRLDKTFPAITKVTPQDVAEKVKESAPARMIGSIKTTTISFKDAAFSRIKSYNSSARPKVNPYLSPVNDKLQGMLDSYLPANGMAENASEVVSNPPSDELERLYTLTSSAYNRAAPKVASLPRDVSSHVQTTFSSQKSSESSLPAAILNTTKQLSNEAYENVVDPLLARYKGSADKATEAVHAVRNGVDSIVDDATTEARKIVNGSSVNGD